MAEIGAEQRKETWPIPEFHFRIEISNAGIISCKEASGLDLEFDMIEYGSGDMPDFSEVKLPGMRRIRNVILKKAIFKNDQKVWGFLTQAKENVIQRESVTVDLLDDSGSPVMSWRLYNAWPEKYSEENFKIDGNSVSMETIELRHEGLTRV